MTIYNYAHTHTHTMPLCSYTPVPIDYSKYPQPTNVTDMATVTDRYN